jgi:hypothetical protein
LDDKKNVSNNRVEYLFPPFSTATHNSFDAKTLSSGVSRVVWGKFDGGTKKKQLNGEAGALQHWHGKNFSLQITNETCNHSRTEKGKNHKIAKS